MRKLFSGTLFVALLGLGSVAGQSPGSSDGGALSIVKATEIVTQKQAEVSSGTKISDQSSGVVTQHSGVGYLPDTPAVDTTTSKIELITATVSGRQDVQATTNTAAHQEATATIPAEAAKTSDATAFTIAAAGITTDGQKVEVKRATFAAVSDMVSTTVLA